MDPTACAKRIKTAMADGDHTEVIAGVRDLTRWLDRGGFLPVVPWATGWDRKAWQWWCVEMVRDARGMLRALSIR